MRLTNRTFLVGSGRFGFEYSDSMDCNMYLLDGGEDCALIDAGSGRSPERIVKNVEEHGISMDRVTQLLLTHVHGDHAAGASYFRERYGLKVVTSEEAAPWLEQGDMDKTSLNQAKKGGVYPQDFEFPPCPVDRRVTEGETVSVGDLRLKVINTPGHSRGHISFLFEEEPGEPSLFCGDTVFAGGKVVVQNIWDCVIEEYADTVRKLHDLNIDKLYPGHGPFLLSQGSKHINKAHECFQRLEIPPNL